MEYAVLGRVVAGEKLEPVGRDESKQWLVVCCVAGGKDGVRDDLGWVWAELVDVQGVDVSRLPPRAAPPKPTPTPRSLSDATGLDFRLRRSSIAMNRGTRSSTTCGRGPWPRTGRGWPLA